MPKLIAHFVTNNATDYSKGSSMIFLKVELRDSVHDVMHLVWITAGV